MFRYLMIPHIRSVEEARQWVEWTRFPPLGKRGFSVAGADANCRLCDPVEYMEHANKKTFVIFQIEDREAVDCLAKPGKFRGMPSGAPEAAQALLDRGARFITCAGDHGALVSGMRSGFGAHNQLRIQSAVERSSI